MGYMKKRNRVNSVLKIYNFSIFFLK